MAMFPKCKTALSSLTFRSFFFQCSYSLFLRLWLFYFYFICGVCLVIIFFLVSASFGALGRLYFVTVVSSHIYFCLHYCMSFGAQRELILFFF